MWSGDDPSKNGVAQADSSESKETEEMNDSTSIAAACLASMRSGGRERSLSVPCRSEASNVDTVMTKAKRASSYLWMLLHSQNCRLGVDRCTHSGCADAKLVHLHLKTCPAGHDFPCPTRYTGCVQARKLLAHYRQCRNIRARQVGQAKGQHVCLICSMVARQARSLLDNNAPSSSKSSVAHKKSSSNSKCQIVSSFTVKAKLNTGALSDATTSRGEGQRNILTSFTLSADNNSAEFMPPPAPRPRLSKSAPVSPMGGPERQELKGKAGSALGPIPLLRKRSESLGSGSRRGVSFAARPQFLDSRPDSLVAVELADTDDDGTRTKAGRGRSASCHLLSTSTSSDTCGTIYEEVGPAASCMDE